MYHWTFPVLSPRSGNAYDQLLRVSSISHCIHTWFIQTFDSLSQSKERSMTLTIRGDGTVERCDEEQNLLRAWVTNPGSTCGRFAWGKRPLRVRFPAEGSRRSDPGGVARQCVGQSPLCRRAVRSLLSPSPHACIVPIRHLHVFSPARMARPSDELTCFRFSWW